MARAAAERRLEVERHLEALAFVGRGGLQPSLHGEDALLVEDREELLDREIDECGSVPVEIAVGVATP